MTVFPVLIFLFLVGLFCTSAFLLHRSVRRRRYVQAGLLLMPFALLAFYFAHVLFGPFQRNPEKVFRYALGFSLPQNCKDLVAYEKQGFHSGVTIWLRFQATPQTLTSVVTQARFSQRTGQEFSDLQKQQAPVDWWTPPSHASFWLSSEFRGPYSFNNAGLAYDPNSQTAFIYVTGFD